MDLVWLEAVTMAVGCYWLCAGIGRVGGFNV
jgi:hypothetical protein